MHVVKIKLTYPLYTTYIKEFDQSMQGLWSVDHANPRDPHLVLLN